MMKTIFVLFLAFAGCNYGTSIADQKPTNPTGTGGVGETGGVSGTANGGENGTAAGGASGIGNGGSTAHALGGATNLGTGGAAGPEVGGAPHTGGRIGGAGGDGPSDAGAAGSAVGGRDSGPTPTATGGAPGTTGGTRGAAGAPGTGGTPGTGGAAGTGGSVAACIPAASPGSKGMDTGQPCLDCHVAGGRMSRRIFTAAGTLYAGASGGPVVSGATITITGSDNKKVTIVTASDGNFYTSSAIAFPATVAVSKCPDTAAMSTTITSGNCNDCHGSSMRVHLP